MKVMKRTEVVVEQDDYVLTKEFGDDYIGVKGGTEEYDAAWISLPLDRDASERFIKAYRKVVELATESDPEPLDVSGTESFDKVVRGLDIQLGLDVSGTDAEE